MRKIYFSILLIVFSISMVQDIGIASESKLKLSVPLNDCAEIIKGNYKKQLKVLKNISSS